MQIENMTEEDVGAFKTLLTERQKLNPELKGQVFNGPPLPTTDRLDRLEATATRIENLLKHIFGDHVLIRGKFRSTHNLVNPSDTK